MVTCAWCEEDITKRQRHPLEGGGYICHDCALSVYEYGDGIKLEGYDEFVEKYGLKEDLHEEK